MRVAVFVGGCAFPLEDAPVYLGPVDAGGVVVVGNLVGMGLVGTVSSVVIEAVFGV